MPDAPTLSSSAVSLPPIETSRSSDRRTLGYIGTLRRAGRLPGAEGSSESLASTGKAHRRPGGPAPEGGHDVPEELLRTDWSLVERVKQRTSAPLRKRLSEVFSLQADWIMRRLRRLQRRGQPKALLGRAAEIGRAQKEGPSAAIERLVLTQLIDWDRWGRILTGGGRAPDGTTAEGAEPGLMAAAQEGFDTGALRTGVSGIDFTSTQRRVRPVIGQILARLEGIQGTWRQELSRQIQQGLAAGDDWEDIQGAARALGAQHTEGWRLDRAVRTAANGGFEKGQSEAFREAGVSDRAWLSERDPRVRGTDGDEWSHREADEQTRPVGTPFFIPRANGGGGENLRHPGDPAGSKSNIIRCRCSQRPQVSADDEGLLA